MNLSYDLKSRSIVGQITVYSYGKLYTPSLENHDYRQTRKRRSRKVMFHPLDRPRLISKIHHFLHVHRLMRDCGRSSGAACSTNMHNALKRIVRTCYDLKISTSCLYPVGEIFIELYKCSGHSGDLFSVVLCSHKDDPILYPERDDKFSAFEYYLQHLVGVREVAKGAEATDLINCDIDSHSGQYNILPLSAALQKRCPELVLCLLKYGADPFKTNDGANELDQNPTVQLIADLNGLHMFKNTGFSKDIRSKLAEQESKAWLCFTYIRRAVPTIPVTSTTHIVTSTEEDNGCDSDTTCDRPIYSLHPKIAEAIDMNYFKFASLKQLCRCAMRTNIQAHKNRVASLPKGIDLLPLPQSVKNYLNLESD